jgi:biotin carboxyl carrier protein
VAKLEPAWLETVRRAAEQLASSRLHELEISQKSFRLRLRRRAPQAAALTPPSESPRDPLPPCRGEGLYPSSAPDTSINAPFTGIFYHASSPSADPYVKEGEWVEAGATIGLIEAMKVFNEVKTEQSGRVERVMVRSGELVQAGEPLLTLKPGKPPHATAADA